MKDEYEVRNVPPCIKGKVTQLINAAHEAAFAGAQPPAVARYLEEKQDIARYNLLQTIKTELEKAAKKGN